MDSGDRAALEVLLNDAMAASPAAGLAVGVVWDDKEWLAARGFAQKTPLVAATPHTTFRLASVTKTFTAVLAMQLVEAGTLGLDDEVHRWVPSFPQKPWPITVRELLAHTSGLPHYKDAKDARFTSHHSTAESLAIFAERDLVAAPGARFSYSSFGYNLLGAVIEAASGMSYGALLQRQILTPLGMSHSGLEDDRLKRSADDALGYRLLGGRVVPSESIDISSRFAGGGARSTVEDMLRYAHALLDHRLVRADTFRAMLTPPVTADGKQADYGLGFAVYPQRGLFVVAHAGGQPEASTLLFLVPDQRLAIVLASNLEDDQRRLSALATGISERLLTGRTSPEAPPLTDPIDDIVKEGLNRVFTWGVATAEAPEATAADIDRAFAALPGLLAHDVIAADPAAARERIAAAASPAAGRITPLVGREMVRIVVAGFAPELRRAGLASLRARGALALFSAYLDACGSDRCAPSRTLPPAIVDDVRRLSAGLP